MASSPTPNHLNLKFHYNKLTPKLSCLFGWRSSREVHGLLAANWKTYERSKNYNCQGYFFLKGITVPRTHHASWGIKLNKPAAGWCYNSAMWHPNEAGTYWSWRQRWTPFKSQDLVERMAISLRAQDVHVGLVIVHIESGAGSPLLRSTESVWFCSCLGHP